MSSKAILVRFVGQKLLYDLTTEIMDADGADLESYQKLLELSLCVLQMAERLNYDDDYDENLVFLLDSAKTKARNLFESATQGVKSSDKKRELTLLFNFFLKLYFENSSDEVSKNGDQPIIRPNIGMFHRSPSPQRGKRKKGNEDEDGEERDTKKLRRPERRVFALWLKDIPQELWVEIFRFLPKIRDLLNVGASTVFFMNLVKTVVAQNFHFLIARSNEFANGLTNQTALVNGTLDLSFNHIITSDTLSNFANLTGLYLKGNNTIKMDDLKGRMVNLRILKAPVNLSETTLATFTNLRRLTLYVYNSIRGEYCFKYLKNLTFLKLYNVRNDLAILSNINSLENLEELVFHCSYEDNHPPFNEDCAEGLRKLKKLSIYSVAETPMFPDDDDDFFSNLQNLKTFVHRDADYLNDAKLKYLTNLTHLDMNMGQEYIPPDINPVTDESLSSMVNLTTLELSAREGVIGTCFANMPNLKRLNISETPIEEEYIRRLTSLTSLKADALNVHDRKLFSADCFEIIGENLLNLQIESSLQMEINAPRMVGYLSNLTSISIGVIDINLENVAKLTSLEKLVILGVSKRDFVGGGNRFKYKGPFVTDKALELCPGLTRLKRLKVISHEDYWVRGCFVRDESINSVLELLGHQLEEVTVGGSNTLKDETVAKFTSCKKLEIHSCKQITRKTISALTSLESLKISLSMSDRILEGAEGDDMKHRILLSNLYNLKRLTIDYKNINIKRSEITKELTYLSSSLSKLTEQSRAALLRRAAELSLFS